MLSSYKVDSDPQYQPSALTGKLIALFAELRALETKQNELDFQKSQVALKIRNEFPYGDSGDKAFLFWVQKEIGCTLKYTEELLARANLAKIIPTEKEYKKAGGYQKAKFLMEAPKEERSQIYERSKVRGTSVKTEVTQAGYIAPTTPRFVPAKTQTNKLSKEDQFRKDLKLFADFCKSRKDLTPIIKQLVTQYS